MITSKCSIEDIYKRKITVPKFQRDYVWDDNNRLELWEDLNNYLVDDNNKFFLGTILLIGEETSVNEAKDKQDLIYDVIDGQQRLTTITILLLALKIRSQRVCAFAADNGKEDIWKVKEVKQRLSYSVHERIKSILTGQNPDLHAPFTFTPNENIQNTFLAMAEDQWSGILDKDKNTKLQDEDYGEVKKTYDDFNLKIKEATDAFDTDIQKYNYILDLYNLITKTELIEVVNEDIAEAGRIFEGLNDRGEPLGVGDLMKNYILMSIDNKEAQDEFINKWKKICQRTNSKSDKNNNHPKPASITTMLKHFAQMVSHTRVAKSNLYKVLKKYYDDECEKKWDKFIESLETFSEIYQNFIISSHDSIENFKQTMKKYTDESVDNKLYLAINLFRIHSLINPTPMICSLFFALKNKDIKIKHFTKAILAIENYSVVYQWILDKSTNQKDFDYKDYSAFLYNSELKSDENQYRNNNKKYDPETAEKIITKFIDSFKAESVSEKEFIKEFKRLSYEKSAIKNRQIVNLLLRIRLAEDQIKDNDTHMDSLTYKASYECEHFYPASKKDDVAVYQEDSIYNVNSIGNLLPLSGKRNKEFTDSYPIDKLKKWEEKKDSSDRYYLDKFSEEYKESFEDWNLKSIEKRADNLAKKAYGIWVEQ